MKQGFWKTLLSSPWSFVWGGLAIGVAESVYYLWYRSPINITFALAEVAAALENRIGLEQALFSRGYAPGVNGVFLGLVAGGLVAALFEGARRRVHYPWRTLTVAFFGGALSGLGAVLAQGDTLYHFIGGVAMLRTSSLFMVAFAIPFVFLALELMALLGVAPAFEASAGLNNATDRDETAATARGSHGVNPQLLFGIAVVAIMVAIALVVGMSGPGLILLGIVMGVGVARSGYGVEWSLLAPDSLASSPRFLRQLGMTPATVRDLRHPAALKALLTAVILPSATALVIWILDGFPATLAMEITDGRGLDIGHVAGAPLLAIGSVLMIGCEFRNYTRMGLGYTTALASLAGLLVGYIPGALWGVSVNSWTQSNKILLSSWLPDFISSNTTIWIMIWVLFLLALLLGIRFTPASAEKNI